MTAATFDHARPRGVRGPLRRAAPIVGNLLAAVGIVLCVPFVIMAIGIPIALAVRFLLFLVGKL